MEEGGGPAAHYVSKEDEEWGRGWKDQLTTIPPFFSSSSDQEKPPPPQDSFLDHSVRKKNAAKIPEILLFFLKKKDHGIRQETEKSILAFFVGKEGTKARQFWNSGVLLVLGKKSRETDGLLAAQRKDGGIFFPPSPPTKILHIPPREKAILFLQERERKKGICIPHPKKTNPDSTHVAFAEKKKSGMRKNTAKKRGKYVFEPGNMCAYLLPEGRPP